MNTEEIIDTETDNEESGETKTPFPWKKVLLAPFKALWCVVFYLAKSVWWVVKIALKTAWWFSKLALFFAFIGLGILAIVGAIAQGFSDRGAGASNINENEYEWVNGRRVLVKKRFSSRMFGVAGRIWQSLWGGSSEAE